MQWRLPLCLDSPQHVVCSQGCVFPEGHTEGLHKTARAGVKCSIRLPLIPAHPRPTLSKKHCSIQIIFSFTGHGVQKGFGKPAPETCFRPPVLTLTLSLLKKIIETTHIPGVWLLLIKNERPWGRLQVLWSLYPLGPGHTQLFQGGPESPFGWPASSEVRLFILEEKET